MVHMTPFSGDFIDPDVDNLAEISVCQSIIDNALDGFTDRVPMKTKELANDVPSHKFGPCSQDHTERQREWALSLGPGEGLHLNATGTAFDSSGRIHQGYGDSPKRDMLPSPLIQHIVSRPLPPTRRADDLESLIGNQIDHHFTVFLGNLFDAMRLESQGFSHYTFNEHKSYPPFLSDLHQQELLDLIHAFKFLINLSTHKFV